MSLESKIEALTAAVLALTERLDDLCAPALPWEKVEKTEKTEKPEKPEKPEKTKSGIEPEKITAQELMRICLDMVQADRAKKGMIKTIFSSYGGKTIAEVDPEKYPALKAELEGLA